MQQPPLPPPPLPAANPKPRLRPHPQPSSAAWRPSKRHRSSQSHSRPSSDSSRNSRAFSSATKQALQELYGALCWHCDSGKPDVAHIFAVDDDTFDDYKELGLLNLESHHSRDNGILLCGTCHRHYDLTWKPVLLIVPTHLDFFREAEIRWQTLYRESAGPRIVPTAEAYHGYSFPPQQAGHDGPEYGGLFSTYADSDFIGPATYHGDGYFAPRQWHGDPMAIIYRAIRAAERLIRPRGLPLAVRRRILELRDLYEQGNRLLDEPLQAGHANYPQQGPADGADAFSPDSAGLHPPDTGSGDFPPPRAPPPFPSHDGNNHGQKRSSQPPPAADHQSAVHDMLPGPLSPPNSVLSPSPRNGKRTRSEQEHKESEEASPKRLRTTVDEKSTGKLTNILPGIQDRFDSSPDAASMSRRADVSGSDASGSAAFTVPDDKGIQRWQWGPQWRTEEIVAHRMKILYWWMTPEGALGGIGETREGNVVRSSP